MSLTTNLTHFVAEPAVTTTLVTGTAFLANKFAPSKYNPFTATYKAAAVVALGADLIARVIELGLAMGGVKIDHNATYQLAAKDAATIVAGTSIVTVLNNTLLNKYFPSLGLITPKGAIAISAAVFVARFIIASGKEFASHVIENYNKPSIDTNNNNNNKNNGKSSSAAI